MSRTDDRVAEQAAVAAELRERYPSLYEPPCEITIGRGWLPLLRELSEKALVTELRYGQRVIVLQVKEKFGKLRFYYRLASPDLEAAVAQAEAQSTRCCEDCGEPGRIREVGVGVSVGTSALRTLCDDCKLAYLEPY